MSSIYSKLIEIAHFTAKIPGLKFILKPFYYPVKNLILKKKNSVFRKNALSIVQEFTLCLEENNIPYTIAFGTLLGGVREKGFIKHDLDIDLAMWVDERPLNLAEILQDKGFKLDHVFKVEDGRLGLEETYKKKGVGIDIFYFYQNDDGLPYCCDFVAYGDTATFSTSMKKYGKVLARRIELPMTRQRILLAFEHLKLYAPINAHEILSFRYGNDYMTPKPNWIEKPYDAHILRWDDVTSIYYKI